MNDREIRQILADGLEAGAVHQVNDVSTREAFLAGTRDLTFEELEMDSLAKMELCIAIEVNAGVSVLPEQLRKIGSLGRLVAWVEKQQ